MLSVAIKPIMLSVINLSVIMLSVIMLSVIMLSVIMLSVIMLSVIMLAPFANNLLQEYCISLCLCCYRLKLQECYKT